MATLRKRGKNWSIIFRLNGRQRWLSTGLENRKDAERALKEFERNQGFEKLCISNEKKITLAQFINEYYLPWTQATKAHKSFLSNRGSCKYLLKFFEDILIQKIDYAAVENYKVWRLNQGLAHRSVNMDLICLGQLLKEARDRGFLTEVPRVKKLREERKLPRFLSKEEIMLLLENSSIFLKPIALIALNTGLRHSELCHIRWADVDWKQRILKVTMHGSYKTKNRRERAIGLNNDALLALAFLKNYWICPNSRIAYPRTPEQNEYVICDKGGKPMNSLKKSLERTVKKAGLKNVSWHTFRHTWASQLVMAGVSLAVVKEGLGHSNISTTNIYVHLSPNYQLDAQKSLDLGQNVSKLLALPGIQEFGQGSEQPIIMRSDKENPTFQPVGIETATH